MSFQRILLLVTGTIWTLYGMSCFMFPDTIFPLLGYDITKTDAQMEFWAMYGGLQTGVGLMFLFASGNEKYWFGALMAMVMIVGGLMIGRIVGIWSVGDISGYSVWVIIYEGITTGCVVAGLIKQSNAHPEQD